LRLKFAPIVVGIEDGVQKAVARSDAADHAADGTLELPECSGEHGFPTHVEIAASYPLDSFSRQAIPNIVPQLAGCCNSTWPRLIDSRPTRKTRKEKNYDA
jgi:hypothetical protein